MEEGLQTALTFLAYTCVILFIVLGVFIVILVQKLFTLVDSYTKLSETIQREINPTLEEIKKALESVNGLASGVGKQVAAVKSSFGSAYNLAFNTVSKLKGASVAVLGGLLAGFKLFSKNKK